MTNLISYPGSHLLDLETWKKVNINVRLGNGLQPKLETGPYLKTHCKNLK